jgi:hypothetical protein
MLSLCFFLGSVVALPWFVGRLPRDYFVNSKKVVKGSFLLQVLRNVLGGMVFLAGVVMLFVPGQGVLTMVAGIVIMDFPGKARFIRKLAKGSRVRTGLNWLRKKGGHPPLIFSETDG